MSDWISITAQYDSKCMICDEEILKGNVTLWQKGIGIKHESCPEKQTQVVFEQKPPIIWNDSKQYSYAELLKITSCQRCGCDMNKEKECHIDDGRKTCSRCFSPDRTHV